MAIHYAHLVMLAETGHRLGRPTRAASARRSTRSISPACGRRRTTAECEDLFFYIDRLLVETLRGRRRRPAAHGAQPQRHRHDDVPDARCANGVLDLDGRGAGAAAGAHRRRARAPRRRSFPRTRTRSRRSRRRSRTTCSAVIEQLERDTARLLAAYSTHQPVPARRLRDHRDRLSDRSRAHERSARLRRARPATPTAASRRSTTCSRARRATAIALDRARPVRAGPAAVVHERSRLSAAARRLRAVEQHHAAEAQSGRARARARARVEGGRQAAAALIAVHNTPFGDIVDTEDDLQPLVASPSDATRARGARRGGDGRRRVRRRRGCARARREDWVTIDRAGRHAGARSRPVVQGRRTHRVARRDRAARQARGVDRRHRRAESAARPAGRWRSTSRRSRAS